MTPGGGPLVTVVVPAFDAAATLPATLASVRVQTYSRLQILVVDDGSRDGTAAVADAAAAEDPRIRVLRRANGGVARARNAGLAEAEGELVAWIDADDLWHPEKVARQVPLFAAPNPPTLVYAGYRLIDGDDRVIPNRRPLVAIAGRSLALQVATNFFSNVSSAMAPTALVRRLGGHDPRLRDEGMEGAEDLLLQLRLAALGPVQGVNEALVGYRRHAGNMSRDHARSARSNLRALELLAKDAPALPGWVLRTGRARVTGYAAHCLAEGHPLAAARILGRGMRSAPIETLAMWARLLIEVAGPLRHRMCTDPAVGQTFLDADPRTAPWGDPILLSSRTRARLDDVDAGRGAQDRPASSVIRSITREAPTITKEFR